MSALKEKIITFIKDNNLNPSSFCKNTHLSPAAIHNILKADIPNPTIDTVLEISRVMDCSLDDLLDQNHSNEHIKKIENIDLLKSVCISICVDGADQIKSFGDFFKATKNIYNYCLKNNLKSSDKNFVRWYLQNKNNINI